MKKLMTYALAFIAFAAGAQNAEIFTPYQATDLRVPAVPLIQSDPYLTPGPWRA